MIKRIWIILSFLSVLQFPTYISAEPATADSLKPIDSIKARSILSLSAWKEKEDALQKVNDSLCKIWLQPDTQRPNQFIDSLVRLCLVKDIAWPALSRTSQQPYHFSGKPIAKGEPWVLLFLLFQLLLFAFLKWFYPQKINLLLCAIYSDRSLSRINKEEHWYNFWFFTPLFMLFGLSIGMSVYFIQYLTGNQQTQYTLPLLCSCAWLLFISKAIIVRISGYAPYFKKAMRDYLSVIYVYYFNAAFACITLNFAFALTPQRYAYIHIHLSAFLLITWIIAQFLRMSLKISAYSFPKMYIYLYFCALEICPLLLVKALI